LPLLAKLISGLYESVLAIPIIGGLIVIGNAYIPLFIGFILHLVTLIICVVKNYSFKSSILGIITSLIAWIPFVGWFFHSITSLSLFVSIFFNYKRKIHSI